MSVLKLAAGELVQYLVEPLTVIFVVRPAGRFVSVIVAVIRSMAGADNAASSKLKAEILRSARLII
jgi:hypothetical protein